MITPILERMLLTGRAIKRSKVHGLSGAGLIRCPKDRFIIITDFTYYAFADRDGVTTGSLFFQMNLRGAASDNFQDYVFKNVCNLDFAGAVGEVYPVHRMDCFDIFKSDVIITINRVSDVAVATDMQFSALKPQAQQLLPPNGYGISSPVLRSMTSLEGTMNFPSGIPENYDLAATARARENFGSDVVVAQTVLTQPTTSNHIPCVNFTVIEVESKAMENLQ